MSNPPVASARKRRRPALACEQCRRRKIRLVPHPGLVPCTHHRIPRCDRNIPCENCARSNGQACTYVIDDRVATTDQGHAIDLNTAPSSARTSPSASGESSVYVPNPTLPGAGMFDARKFHLAVASEGSNVQALTDRVRQLEQKLAEAVSVQSSTSAAGQNGTPIKGRFLKTRFFGNTHRSSSAYKVRRLSICLSICLFI
jgi:hypothetical protein